MPEKEQQSTVCRTPPPLTEDQISDVIDDAASQAVLAHLERCPACRQRVEQARMTEKQLTQRLYRFDCPPAQILSDYHLGFVPTETRPEIEKHLAQCLHCQAELSELTRFLKLESTTRSEPESMPEKPRLRLQDLLAIFVPPSPQLVLRGVQDPARPVLSTSSSVPLEFEIAEITIFIELDDHYTVTGQLVTETDSWQGALVHVWHYETLHTVTQLDDMGLFNCGPLGLGMIDVQIIAVDGRLLMIQDIELQE